MKRFRTLVWVAIMLLAGFLLTPGQAYALQKVKHAHAEVVTMWADVSPGVQLHLVVVIKTRHANYLGNQDFLRVKLQRVTSDSTGAYRTEALVDEDLDLQQGMVPKRHKAGFAMVGVLGITAACPKGAPINFSHSDTTTVDGVKTTLRVHGWSDAVLGGARLTVAHLGTFDANCVHRETWRDKFISD